MTTRVNIKGRAYLRATTTRPIAGRGAHHARWLCSAASGPALCLMIIQPTAAAADPSQQQLTVDQTIPAGEFFVVPGKDYSTVGPAPQGGGAAGGDSNGWVVTQTSNTRFVSGGYNTAIAVGSRGGTGQDGADGGSILPDQQPGGKGGDAGAVSYTIANPISASPPPVVIGVGTAGAIAISTVAGNGGMGQSLGTSSYVGGPGGAAGQAGDISFSAYQDRDNLPSVYTYIAADSGAAKISLTSQGGNGGVGGQSQERFGTATGANGADGAKGGNITASFDVNLAFSGGQGLVESSIGGNGGAGGTGSGNIGSGTGGRGGAGAVGGDVSVTVWGGAIQTAGNGARAPINPDGSGNQPSLNSVQAALRVQSEGGLGGNTGGADGLAADGGRAGNAGNGGTVSVNLLASGLYQNDNYQINRNLGAIHTTGDDTLGILASSVGGAGGGGTSVGGVFSKKGGQGGLGGTGGLVAVTMGQYDSSAPYALITTEGKESDAVIAQSVGGGGGVGGDVNGGGFAFAYQHGGGGGNGGQGGEVGWNNGYWTPDGSGTYIFQNPYVIHTLGTDSYGALLESIGGGGGRGGDAIGTSLGLQLTIGGSGGTGGSANKVHGTNYGIIQTEGDQSIGVFAQSVGGGGGAGGTALGVTVSSVVTTTITVGGSGGSGGNGDVVNLTNFGQVLTNGANATALFAQSIGGGGGNGGSSLASSFAINPPEIPSVTATVAVGGTGGAAGAGAAVTLLNAGFLATRGENAYGVFAQSVGGGGGNGGDATAASQANIQSQLTVSTAIGGKGGGGGNGDNVTVANSGLINTLGYGSTAVFAQSIGGGGGNGGSGRTDQGAYDPHTGYSASITVGLGGAGGTGGSGLNVSAYNYIDSSIIGDESGYHGTKIDGAGGILTLGDAAAGMFAQSVGGGGGNAGDGIGKGGNGSISVNIGIGGNGGIAGDGGNVILVNGGAIRTLGASAPGMFGQSVGGGGGNGGNAATGAGDDPQYSYNEFLGNKLASALGVDASKVEKVTDNLWDWKDNIVGAYGDGNRLNEIAGAYTNGDDSLTGNPIAGEGLNWRDVTIDVGAGYAGNGGAGGAGNTVSLSNNGSISTSGAESWGMAGQSIGGGGGNGGASSASTANDKLKVALVQGSISLGGRGGMGGDGGSVALVNSGTISTGGDLSLGMLGQSIGAGGGTAGVSTSTGGLFGTLAVSLGADGTTTGSGHDVTLTSSGNIYTSGNDAIAMIGQSIGGGGGIIFVSGENYDATTKLAYTSSQQSIAGAGEVRPSFLNTLGGDNGGSVTEELSGSANIVTAGINAYGILAQSIGGGGGIMLVGPTTASPCSLFERCGNETVQRSDGGTVTVTTDPNTSIVTTGPGAAGIVAQSIGGGGGLVNGLNNAKIFNTSSGGISYIIQGSLSVDGAGAPGFVQVVDAGYITTTGPYAHGIFAEAVTNGGGIVGDTIANAADQPSVLHGLSRDTYKGNCSSACQGSVEVDVDRGRVLVSGDSAYGVVAFSAGSATNLNKVAINVVDGGSIVASGAAAGGILILGQDGGVVNVGSGSAIDASSAASHIAIQGFSGYKFSIPGAGTGYTLAPTVINNYGTIIGKIVGNGYGTVNNYPGAVYDPKGEVDLGEKGVLNNAGALLLNETIGVASVNLTGSFVQQASGVLRVESDLGTGSVTPLVISGTAVVGGSVQFTASPTHKTAPVTVLSAAGGVVVQQDQALLDGQAHALFSNDLSVSANTLQVTTNAHFNTLTAGSGTANKSVGQYLQAVWNSGQSIDNGFLKFASVEPGAPSGSALALSTSLNSLAGQTLGAIAATRYRAGQTFVNNMLGGCPDGEENGRCVWGHFADSTTNRATTEDVLGYHLSEQTYQSGVQKEVRDNLYLGTSFEYQHSSMNDSSGFASVSGDNLMGGATLTWRPGPWRLTAGFDVGGGTYSSTRRITVGGASEASQAAPGFFDAGAHVRAAYDWQLSPAWELKPFASLHLRWAHGDAYTETGTGDFNLAVQSESHFELSGDVGAQVRGSMKLPHQFVLHPYISAAVEGLANSNWAATARFAGDTLTDGFRVTTPLPGALGEFAAGVDLTRGERWSLRAQYGRDEGSNFSDRTWSVRFGLAF